MATIKFLFIYLIISALGYSLASETDHAFYRNNEFTSINKENCNLDKLFNSLDLTNKNQIKNDKIIKKLNELGYNFLSFLTKSFLEERIISFKDAEFYKNYFTQILEQVYSINIDNSNLNIIFESFYKKMISTRVNDEITILNKNFNEDVSEFLSKNYTQSTNVLRRFTFQHLNLGSFTSSQILKEISIEGLLDRGGLIIHSEKQDYLPLQAPKFNGSYGYSVSSDCVSNSNPLVNVIEWNNAQKSSCDRGNYSQDGHGLAGVSIVNKASNSYLWFKVSTNLSATGGYACENFAGRPRNCRDYSSQAYANLKSKIIISPCRNIYQCLPVVDVRVLKSMKGLSVPDFKNEPITILRDVEKTFDITIEQRVDHSSGTGSSSLNDFSTIQIKPNPDFDLIDYGNDTFAAILAYLNKMNEDIKHLNTIATILELQRQNSETKPEEIIEEEKLLYSVLIALNSNYSKHNSQTKVAWDILFRSIKNRIYEIRKNSVKSEIQMHANFLKEKMKRVEKLEDLLLRTGSNISFVSNEIETFRFALESLLERKLPDLKQENKNLNEDLLMLVTTEKNSLLKLKLKFKKILNEYKLYYENNQFENMLH